MEMNLIKCPHCAELIQPDAKVCKHCGRNIVSPAQAKQNTKIFLMISVALVLCLCFAFIGFYKVVFPPEPQTAADFAKEYDGSETIYAEILSSNDCTYLQSQFDQAYETSQQSAPGTIHHKRATGFMTASDKRMKEIGCY